MGGVSLPVSYAHRLGDIFVSLPTALAIEKTLVCENHTRHAVANIYIAKLSRTVVYTSEALSYLLGLNRPRDELSRSCDADQRVARHLAVDGRLNVPRHDRVDSHARCRSLARQATIIKRKRRRVKTRLGPERGTKAFSFAMREEEVKVNTHACTDKKKLHNRQSRLHTYVNMNIHRRVGNVGSRR